MYEKEAEAFLATITQKPIEAVELLSAFAQSLYIEANARSAQSREVVLTRGMASGAAAEARHWERLYRDAIVEHVREVSALTQRMAEVEAQSKRFELSKGCSSKLEAVYDEWHTGEYGAQRELVLQAAALDQQNAFALINAQIERMKLKYPQIALEMGFMG